MQLQITPKIYQPYAATWRMQTSSWVDVPHRAIPPFAKLLRSLLGKGEKRGRQNVTVHGGGKLGVIKSSATGIEVDIDGLGRGGGSRGPGGQGEAQDDALPPWLQGQLPEADKMTMTDLNRINEQLKHEDTMNSLDVFSDDPQGQSSEE